MSKKKKKTPQEELENGIWVKERGLIKGAIRRAFRQSPHMKIALQNARVEKVKYNKDGSKAKRPDVYYRCAMCGELFKAKNVQVDHIEPVVPLFLYEKELSYDRLVRNIFCNVDNLQVLCSTKLKDNNGEPSCHKIKSDVEKYVRKQLFKTDELKEDKRLREKAYERGYKNIFKNNNTIKDFYEKNLRKKKNGRKKQRRNSKASKRNKK